MEIKVKKLFIIYGMSHSLFSYAVSDPVSWNLSPSTNPVKIQAGGQASAVYTLTSHLPGPAVITTKIQSSGGPLTYKDLCNNTTLNPGKTCTIKVFFNPTAAGTSTFKLNYKYNNNVINTVPVWTAIASQSIFSLNGQIEGFPTAISYPGLPVDFTVSYVNEGSSALTNCFLGDASGANQLVLEPNSVGQGQLQVLSSNCGTISTPISLPAQSAGNNQCVVSGRFTPSQLGTITVGSEMTCQEASSNPQVNSTIVTSAPGLTGQFTQPNPFPTTFYTNQQPFVTAQFTNTGNVPLTNCRGGDPAAGQSELIIAPSSAATVTTNVPTQGTCGAAGSPITINPGDPPCSIYGQLSNLQSPNNATLTASVTCDQATASTQKSFAIQTSSGSCTSASVTPTLLLPTSTYKYADNMVAFQVTNTCATGESINLGTVAITATAGSATITGTAVTPPAIYDNCSNTTLAAGANCTIMVSVIPTSTGALTVQASVDTGGGSPATGNTTATVQSNNQPNHHILFVNQCPFDVWYGVANGNGSSCPGTACKSPDPNLDTHPNGALPDDYKLPALVQNSTPSTIDLIVNNYQNGAFWPRTGCKMMANGQFNCATGTCQTMSGKATCLSPSGGGTGPVQPQSPYTKFEATIVSTPGQDGVYDVSVINGMTVPVEVKAFGPPIGNTASTVYKCSGAGSLLQPTSNDQLGNCSWDFNPELTMSIPNINSDFYWVTPGADTGCANGINCGMSYSSYPQSNGNSPGPINRHQGNFLGFNPLVNDAAYTISTQWGSRNLFTLYSMGVQIAGQTPGDNYGTTLVATGTNIVLPGNTYPAYNVLLSIPGITNTGALNSCYQEMNTNFSHCGGCIDWSITLPSEQCGHGSPNYQPNWNLDWTTNPIQTSIGSYTPRQAIEWLKQACPTAYSYQFDDPSSSFQCNEDNNTPLLTSYQVTFCPGGVTGLPAGATEGRSTTPP